MKHGKVVALDRSHIMAMLQDTAFFDAVPEFVYLQPSVHDAATTAAAAARGGACDSCGDLWRYFRPVADAFILRLTELVDMRSTVLQDIRTYLSLKKRYDVRQVVIHYRGSNKGSIKKLTF